MENNINKSKKQKLKRKKVKRWGRSKVKQIGPFEALDIWAIKNPEKCIFGLGLVLGYWLAQYL